MKIAIQGHSARGHEVIQILKSLGGKNTTELNGRAKAFYYIDKGEIYNVYYPPTDYKIYTLEEFEKEFPFKIGDKVIFKDTCFNPIIYTITGLEFYRDELCYLLDDLSFHYSAKKLKLYQPMKEERNITLTLDKAKEWYNKGGELKEIAPQAYTKEELNPLPKNWEEYCKGHKVPVMIFGPCLPNKYIALWKLEQLRDCYRQGWEPDWTRNNPIVSIYSTDKIIGITKLFSKHFLSFQSEEVAKEFKKNFESLIKEAEEFI